MKKSLLLLAVLLMLSGSLFSVQRTAVAEVLSATW